MPTFDTPVGAFPNNVVNLLVDELKEITDVEIVLARPLRPTDPDLCIGVVALDWVPGEFEMTGYANGGPTLSTYLYAIQALVKHADEQEGMLKHALLSKMLRSMLYRGESLRVRLASLNETSLGTVERAQRWGIRQQRFMSNEVSGQFLFLSTTEFFVETETI